MRFSFLYSDQFTPEEKTSLKGGLDELHQKILAQYIEAAKGENVIEAIQILFPQLYEKYIAEVCAVDTQYAHRLEQDYTEME